MTDSPISHVPQQGSTQPRSWHITDLPSEIIHYIASRLVLENKDRLNFSLTCLTIRDAVNSGAGDALSAIDPTIDGSLALARAARDNNLAMAELLLKDPRVQAHGAQYPYKSPIEEAARNGHADMVSLLLQDSRVDPRVNNGEAFLRACHFGWDKVVEVMLGDPRVDPCTTDGAATALQWAAKEGYFKVVKLLLACDRVEPLPALPEAVLGKAQKWSDPQAWLKGREVDHSIVVSLLLADPRTGLFSQPREWNLKLLAKASFHGSAETLAVLAQDPRLAPLVNRDGGPDT